MGDKDKDVDFGKQEVGKVRMYVNEQNPNGLGVTLVSMSGFQAENEIFSKV
jgi:hypothetical protein